MKHGKNRGNPVDRADRTSARSGTTRSAFTLIELLVVIAIISLLTTILMPSLTRAKQLAKDAICASNLKGLGTAVYYYLEESNGTYPALQQWGRGTDSLWYRDLAKVLGWDKIWLKKPGDWTIEEETEILTDPGIFLCPMTDRSVIGKGFNLCWGSPPQVDLPAGSWFVEHLSYGYNGDFGWHNSLTTWEVTWINSGDVIMPQLKVLIADSDNKLNRDYYVYGSSIFRLGNRHTGDLCNILYSDGHVNSDDRFNLHCSYDPASEFVSWSPDAKQNIMQKHWYTDGKSTNTGG